MLCPIGQAGEPDPFSRGRQRFIIGSATTTAGFGVVVDNEDFTADHPTHISIKPKESDLKDCYIEAFESYSQK